MTFAAVARKLWGLLTPQGWLTLAAVLLACVALLAFCEGQKGRETARDQGTIADARTDSAQAAIAAIGDNAVADTETQTQVREAQDAIRQAPPADRDRVARQQLCQLQGRSPC